MNDTGEDQGAAPKGPEALEDVTLRAAEFSEYLGSYLRTQRDRASLSVRKMLRAIFLAFFVGLLIAGILVTGIAFFFYGIALGLREWFGHDWLSYLTTGGVTLLLFGIAIRIFIFGGRKPTLKSQVQDYEDQLRSQQKRFGNNALERSAELAE